MDICDPCIGFCDEMEVLNLQDYIFSNDFTRNIDAMIYTCGYENCAPGHSYGPVMRNGYLIHYIKRLRHLQSKGENLPFKRRRRFPDLP